MSSRSGPVGEGASKTQRFDDEPDTPKGKRKRNLAEEIRDTPEPGSKKSKTSKSQGSPTADVVAQNGDDNPPEVKKKRKKIRRGKKRTGATEPEEPDSAPETEPAPEPQDLQNDAEQEEDEKRQKKNETKEKKKKKKKSKSGDAEKDDVPMADAGDSLDASSVTMENMTEPEDKLKKRREKKKKTKEPEPDKGEDDDEIAKRHKAVLERKAKSLKLASEMAQNDSDHSDVGELHGLEPLPQPEPISLTTSRPAYETLPPWLAEPIRVAQDTRASFTELGVLPKAARVLEEKGFREAFAVQTAAIPLLLPTSKQQPGDVLVSAATGSGKTLAYALPITRDISRGVVTRLRALVVLPTRELVKQAQEAFELCAKAFEGGERKRVRIGVSIGSQSLKNEQENLMERETRYDPDAYEKLQEENRELKQKRIGLSANDDLIDPDSDAADPRLSSMEGYVVDFFSRVDVLICTPGRLVEHMEQTPGFSLDYVRWLVVDEADKLLAQSFQGWLDLAMEKFRVNKFSARDFPDVDLSGVRKVILSATLTRDLSLLNQLALRRPRLIVLENDGETQIAEHSLPVLLREHAIRVHDTNLKPLYLLELLQGQHMLTAGPANDKTSAQPKKSSDSDASSDTSSDSSSDSSEDSDSDTDSDSSSDSSSASDSSSDTSSDSSSDSDSDSDSELPLTRSRKLNIPISLIFTKSNESALRLARLLQLLDPSLSSHIGTLTSTTPTHIRRKTLRSFTAPSSPLRLLIASDLVARGIDLPNLDHVINYDLPASLAGYVHRVGRTARAGRSGCAWTLVGDEESGWFWGKIAKGAGVRRAQKVERTRIEEMDEERVQKYEAALEELGKEVRR